MRQLQLIQLYFYVSKVYKNNLQYHCQRYSNNSISPKFSDVELITTWLFAQGFENCRTDKSIYAHIKNYWLDWFPDLPSYSAYNRRVNQLCSVYPKFLEHLLICYLDLLSYAAEDCFILTDSMPIITCSAKRKAKVALELCDKGYNSTKSMYYYGMKLHGLGFYKKGSLTIGSMFLLGAASEHDLTAQRNILESLKEQVVFADKAFNDRDLEKLFDDNGGALMLPVKYHRGHSEMHKQWNRAADDLYSRAVSKIRQPIESLFAWIIEKTDVQRASKVRSRAGLLKHVFGRIAAAFLANAIQTNLI